MSDHLDGILAAPARLLTADRAEVRDHITDTGATDASDAADATENVGREVFLQAEAIFGVADVIAAEFASWLHFAAKATGHEEHAERIATAEPGMPWRTVWAWWRPANWFMAHPSVNGDYYQVHRRLHEGRELIEVVDQRGPLWLDAETGRRVTVRDEAALAEAPEAPDAPHLHDWELTAPESWEAAVALATGGGRTRHLVVSEHGIAPGCSCRSPACPDIRPRSRELYAHAVNSGFVLTQPCRPPDTRTRNLSEMSG
ncbi:hypothetical protein ACWEO4_31045 [Streptomyces sp. NPDC004393]|uniref:hypothetical protein n=1 Tax=Streptomyces sp. NPDC004533 TaxID=3154278 RepID=UPI0033A9EC33